MAEVGFVYYPGPVSADEGAAPLYEILDPPGRLFAHHVEHRRYEKPVAPEICTVVDHLGGNGPPPELVVVGQAVLAVIFKPVVPRARRVIQGPEVFPVVQHGRFRFDRGARELTEAGKLLSKGLDLLKDAGALVPDVIDHGAVEFLEATPALAPLEVLDAVRPMRHGLNGGQGVHARPLEFGDSLPVRGAGRAFHQQKRPGL